MVFINVSYILHIVNHIVLTACLEIDLPPQLCRGGSKFAKLRYKNIRLRYFSKTIISLILPSFHPPST